MRVKTRPKKHAPLGEAQLDAVAGLFSTLSEPSRLRILQALQAGPATVAQIMQRAQLKQANASKQLGILHQAGVLAREKDGNCVRYSIALPLVFDLCALVCSGIRQHARDRAQLLN